MYYNIYQVGEKPIDKKGYITADSFSDHDFIGRIADYVDNVDDRNYEIKMLAEWPVSYTHLTLPTIRLV